MNEIKMKIQWAQVLFIVITMCYLSGCEKDSAKENSRLMRDCVKELKQEVRSVKSDLLDLNIKLIDIKIELSRFHSNVNTHNLKIERKMP